MSKIIGSSVLVAALLSACAVHVPPPSADAVAASRDNAYWGELGKHVAHTYVNASDTLSIQNPGTGVLNVIARSGGRSEAVERIDITAGETPGTYYVNVLDAFPPHAALVRFDADGHMVQIEGNLGQHVLTIADTEARYWYAYGMRLGRMRPLSETYMLDDGRTIPISKAPGSALQRLHDSLPGFGVWETKVGQTFVGDVSLLRVEKTPQGHLQLVTLSLEGDEGYRFTFDPSPGQPDSAVQYTPNGDAGKVVHATHDQTELRMQFEYNDAVQYRRFFLQGHQILALTGVLYDSADETRHLATEYKPVTEARMVAALERRTQQQVQAAQDAAYAEQRAADAAAERRATEAAVLAGLASGFAQAQSQSYGNPNFERDLNRSLQQIQLKQSQQRDAIQVTAKQLSAANEQARRNAPQATAAAASAPVRSSGVSSSAAEACETVDDGLQTWSAFGQTEQEARRNVSNQAGSGMCMHRGGVVGLTLGQCTEQKNAYTEVDTREPGKLSFNRVSKPSTWQCTATFRCAQPKRVCNSAPARGTRQ